MLEKVIIGCLPVIACFLIAIYRYKQLEPRWFQLFPWYFGTSLFFTLGGYCYSFIFKAGSNHFIFNAGTFVEYVFYLLVLWRAVSGTWHKNIILLLCCCFLISYCIFVFIMGDFMIYNTKVVLMGKLLTLIACVLFLTELLMSEQLINFFSIPMFWITTGILMALVGNFLYIALFDYILHNKLDPQGKIYSITASTLSVIEYTLMAIGMLSTFLWKKRN